MEIIPYLSLGVEACLSVFSGPIVRGIFSILNESMDKTHNRLVTDTYNGILKSKLYQKSTGKTSAESHAKQDPSHSPVDRVVCKSIRLVAFRSKKARKQAREKNRIKLQNMGSKSTVISKQRMSAASLVLKRRKLSTKLIPLSKDKLWLVVKRAQLVNQKGRQGLKKKAMSVKKKKGRKIKQGIQKNLSTKKM